MFARIARASTAPESLESYFDVRVRVVLTTLATIAILAIAVPAVFLIIWSLWGTEVVGRLAPLSGSTLKWFGTVMKDPAWQQSIVVSLLLAIAASSTGILLNATYAYAKNSLGWGLKSATSIVMVLVLLNPLIAYGMALRYMAAISGFSPWFFLYVGHVVVLLPLQFLVFETAEGAVPVEMLWASRSLGAGHVRTMLSVFLPNLRSALLGAFLLGFFVSLDELVLALFTLDMSASTVPLRLWRGMSHVLTPEAAVLSTLMLVLSILAFEVQNAFSSHTRRWTRKLYERLGGFRKEIVLGSIAAAFTLLLDLHVEKKLVEAVIHVAIAVGTSLIVALAIGLVRASSPISSLVTVGNAEGPGLHDVTRSFIFKSLEDDIEDAERLRDGAWVDLESKSLRRLAALSFRKCGRGRYVGTDSNVPSIFYRRYPDYIQTQLQRGSSGGDVRILFCDVEDLRNDARQNPFAVKQFVMDHAAAGVTLLAVPQIWAQTEAKTLQLPSSEFGVFGDKFAVFFEPPTDDDAAASVTIRRMSDGLTGQLDAFLERCVEKCHKVELDRNDQPIFSEIEDRQGYKSSLRVNRES